MNVTIISCIVTASITLIVCLINNAVQLKKQREDYNLHTQDQISEIKKDISKNMADMNSRLEKVIANQENQHMTVRKDLEHITYVFTELDKKVDKHNNLVERTYDLERRADITQQKIDTLTDNIKELK